MVVNKKVGAQIDLKWNWYTLCKELDSRRPSLTIKLVTWEKPPSSWIKVNTDGSSSSENQTTVHLYDKNGIPWELSQCVEEIKDSLQIHQYKIQHCYREANSVADVLAKAASNLQNGDTVFFYNWKDLPRDARGCSRMDQNPDA
ncbi:hypothetical protein A4A49_54237 [Nicotiana attenuata]|uniref:Uncharacterized protein n=1 Tax=Nicotiana attenuata TaxID=49451 RepID=A0A1J6IMU2_NICAT|nr:hypothetical protein A4A49_54237 [Nicotiana attenuata]